MELFKGLVLGQYVPVDSAVRILANMATDSWAPHRFAQLSDRLVTNNGIWLIGIAAFVTLAYTRGLVDRLFTEKFGSRPDISGM